jgi:O-antigen ligase
MAGKGNSALLSSLLYISYIVLLLSNVCAFRVPSSIAIGGIMLFSIIKSRIDTGKYFQLNLNNTFIIGCFAFYLLQIFALPYTENKDGGLRHLTLKSALVIVPLALSFRLKDFFTATNINRLFVHYCLILVVASLYCLVIAAKNYFWVNHDPANFVYHQLVSPFEHHAVQFSIMVFVGLAFLLNSLHERVFIKSLFIHLVLIAYFIFLIILLSSKLIIIYTITYLIFFLVTFYRSYHINRKLSLAVFVVCLLTVAGVLFTSNPISYRFNEIMNGDLEMIEQNKFTPSTSMNGLQFRLLQWRFVKEIITEKNAWVLGLGPGDAQNALDAKYTAMDLYIGNGHGERGFLGYNTHNQFLESFLQNGLLGLLVFLLITFGLIRMMWTINSAFFTGVCLLLILFSITESVFETQYGLMLYVFFPVFLYRIWKPLAH